MEPFAPVPVVDEGLGNSTYLLDVGGGTAVVVDAERDLRQLRAEAARRGLRVAWAMETHLHADFVSGARELAAGEGARVLAPDVGARGFPTTVLRDGDRAGLGAVEIEALHTPGHSPEHLSYLVRHAGHLIGAFTGGSLMVGTAGRTDLLGPDQTIPLARAQYRSLRRLMELPDQTAVWPTHGAGSFCSAATGTRRVSTIGAERATNPLLQAQGEDEFVQALLASLGTFPDYFLRLGALNREGPDVLAGDPRLRPLTPGQVRGLAAADAQVVDVRPAADFAAGHIPGSLSIALRPAFPTWLGWLADPAKPVVVVRNPGQNAEDILWGAAKVGFDSLAGELAGGIDAWRREGTLSANPLVGPQQLATEPTAPVLDVRQGPEFAAGHVPGAAHVELAALASAGGRVDGAAVLMCGHGERAMSGASILERAGLGGLRVFEGGPDDWAASAGRPLAAGA